jgi:hypothetical protein
MLMATENAIHVTCKSTQNSPQEVIFRLDGEHFQPGNQNQHREMSQSLNDFYANKFEQADSDENDYEVRKGEFEWLVEFNFQVNIKFKI